MASKEREYMVVTRYQKTPDSKPIVHVYGPYGQTKAKSIKSNMKAEAIRNHEFGKLEVSVCHPISIENMNREAAEREARGMGKGE